MPKTAFLFPGQGAQSVGMCKELCTDFAPARAVFDRASSILGFDLLELCWNGPEERLNSTAVSQPAIFVASWAALERLRHEKPEVVARCEVAAGLSLGEYTALAFADALGFEQALRVVQLRGEAMQSASEANLGGMSSILGLDRGVVEELCAKVRPQGRLWVANLLGPGNIVVSGDRAALDATGPLAEAAGATKVIPLSVAGAFHTEHMATAVEQLARVLEGTEIRPPRVPVVSNVDARFHSDPNEIRSILARQVVSPVLWEGSMQKLLTEGFDDFYEIGPGRVLRGLLRRMDRKVKCESVGS
jgi:[acyl-carrier-protein] S-malonyltransferase